MTDHKKTLQHKKANLLAAMEIQLVDGELAELEKSPPPLAQLRARAEELRRELQGTGVDGRQAMMAIFGKGADEDPPWGESPKPNLRDLEILVAELAKDPAEAHSTRRLGTCLRSLADNVDPLPESLRCDSPGCTRLGVAGGLTGELTLCPDHERQHERAEVQRGIAEDQGDDEDGLPEKLFEQEVSEIYEKIVSIEEEEDDVQAKLKPGPTRDKPGTLAERLLADPQTSVDWRAVGVREARAERARRPHLSKMSFDDQVDVIVGTVLTKRWGALEVPSEPAAAIREGVRAELAGGAKLTGSVLAAAARRPAPAQPASEEDNWRASSKGGAPKHPGEVERRINRILAKGGASRLTLAQAVGFWDGDAPLFQRVLKKMQRAGVIVSKEGRWHLATDKAAQP